MQKIPDALMIPEGLKTGARMSDRVASVADIAEPLLLVDRARGERAYIRIQPGGRLFVTRDVHDTILFPRGHERDGRPRYNWVPQRNGMEYGYLVCDESVAGGQ
ncbi:MAG: hypothetical protein ACLQIB_04385 [Isosphaeraceae bacterium]